MSPQQPPTTRAASSSPQLVPRYPEER
jgi:hypothetical protein